MLFNVSVFAFLHRLEMNNWKWNRKHVKKPSTWKVDHLDWALVLEGTKVLENTEE